VPVVQADAGELRQIMERLDAIERRLQLTRDS
jgi:tetrahydromethanopterin S-methyltransferase subunit G